MTTVAAIKTLVKEITTLSNSLPPLVQQATKDDKIWSVMNTDEGETAYETFNRRFDAMFGEDCRDSTGRLQHVRKGKFGMAVVCMYLSKCDWADGFPLDLVDIKLQRLVAELRHLRYVAYLSSFVCIAADLRLAVADLQLNRSPARGHHATSPQHPNSQMRTMLLSPSCRSSVMPYKLFAYVLKMPHLQLQGQLYQNHLILRSDHLPSATHLPFLMQDTQNPS